MAKTASQITWVMWSSQLLAVVVSGVMVVAQAVLVRGPTLTSAATVKSTVITDEVPGALVPKLQMTTLLTIEHEPVSPAFSRTAVATKPAGMGSLSATDKASEPPWLETVTVYE